MEYCRGLGIYLCPHICAGSLMYLLSPIVALPSFTHLSNEFEAFSRADHPFPKLTCGLRSPCNV